MGCLLMDTLGCHLIVDALCVGYKENGFAMFFLMIRDDAQPICDESYWCCSMYV